MDWSEGLYPLLPDPNDPNDKPDEEQGTTITHDSLLDYLEGRRFGLLGKPELERESRLGIAMDYDAGRAADSMLYMIEFARLRPPTTSEHYGLLVEVGDDIAWPGDGTISMGGEARASLVRKLSADEEPENTNGLTPPTNRFKIVLLTHAWFAEGWRPENGDWASFFEAQTGTNIKCVAAAIGRPHYLGGWDAARGGHKPLRGFVPPGSVFYFEAAQPVKLPSAFTQTPPGESNFANQGLGAFVPGPWKWLE
jgi:CRISPR-associated protein Cmr3